MQPGKVDQGKYPDDYVGYVRKAYIVPDGYTAFNDFAFILADKDEYFKEPLIYDMDLPWLEPVTSSGMKPGDKLWKPITRTTNLKVGSIVSTGATVSVNYGNDGNITHKDCLITTAMSAGGDSGSWCGKLVEQPETRESLMRDVNRHPSTYLFAGSATTTVHHDLVGAMFGMSIQPYVPNTPQPPSDKIRMDFILEKEGNSLYTVYGTVTDKDKVAIKDCKMDLVGTAINTTYTDNSGNFRFLPVPDGKYSLTATAVGFKPQTKEFTTTGEQIFRLRGPLLQDSSRRLQQPASVFRLRGNAKSRARV